MTLRIGAPEWKHNGALVWPFLEDPVTAAYELAQQAALPAGTALQVGGITLPAWWWQATGLVPDATAKWRLDLARTTFGEAVVLSDDGPQPVQAQLGRALAAARQLSPEAAAALQRAMDSAMRPEDLPLGAHVTATRHDEVLLARLRMPGGTVATWTAIGPGAAPSEFMRLQQAQGTYHVVMVDQGETGRTVGVWAHPEPPATGMQTRPVLRRLFIREGQWRYGVAFAPTL